MSKVYLEELEAFEKSNTLETLAVDSSDSDKVNEILLNFIDKSRTELKGEGWDAYRNKFIAYSNALQARKELALVLEDAIKQAEQLLKDYLGEDLMIDTSRLEEYRHNRQICENSMELLKDMLSKKDKIEYVDKDGSTQMMTSQLETKEIEEQMELAKSTLEELDRIISKIEGLDEVYSQAELILRSAFARIDIFRSQVESLVPDVTYSYRKV